MRNRYLNDPLGLLLYIMTQTNAMCLIVLDLALQYIIASQFCESIVELDIAS